MSNQVSEIAPWSSSTESSVDSDLDISMDSPPRRRIDCDNKEQLECFVGQLLNDRYLIEEKLGEGTYSLVLKCTDTKEGKFGKSVAVKVQRQKYGYAAEHEVEILNTLQQCHSEKHSIATHPLSCTFLLDNFKTNGFVSMVFPLHGASVLSLIERHGALPLKHVKQIMYNTLIAVSHLHQHDLTHADLKPENILFLNPAIVENNVCKCKMLVGGTIVRAAKKEDCICSSDRQIETILVDFGLTVYSRDYHARSVGTRQYTGPEIMLQLPWGKSLDIWSLGCILVELLTGRELFDTGDDYEHFALMQKRLGYQIPYSMVRDSPNLKLVDECFDRRYDLAWPRGADRDSVRYVSKKRSLKTLVGEENQDLYELLMWMLEMDPDRRPSVEQVLRHTFFDQPSRRFGQFRSKSENYRPESPDYSPRRGGNHNPSSRYY